jgi:hypothetical protein
MKAFGGFLALVLIAAVLAGVGYGIYLGYGLLSAEWLSLNREWRAVLTLVSALIIFCTLFLSFSIRSAVKRQSQLAAGKVSVYNEFMDWYSALTNNTEEEADAVYFTKIKNRLLLWGNSSVVKEANLLSEEVAKGRESLEEVKAMAKNLYVEIRRDLGLSSLEAES